MKKFLFLTLLSLLSLAVFAQVEGKSEKKPKEKKKERIVEDTLPKVPVITFKSLVHDYGNIYRHGDGICFFEFKNTGKADLQLTNVSSSCGCTVPEWPKEPIPPGQSASIKVSYNTANVGTINKNVFVDSNVGERVTLNIKGTVSERPQQETLPENKPSQMLKNE